MLMSKTLKVTTNSDGVMTLTINREDRQNSLNGELIDALQEQLEAARDDNGIRVIIITGKGQTFCSGADLSWMKSTSETVVTNNALKLANLLHILHTLPKPTIARINGPAFGGGVGIVACCDLSIATETTYFSFTELRLGLVAAIISPYVIQHIGPRQTKRYFLTGHNLYATQAMEIGLVDWVVDQTKLDDAVTERTYDLMQAGPSAIAECKKLFNEIAPIDSNLIDKTARINARLRLSAEGQEGLEAFLNKRKTKWQR